MLVEKQVFDKLCKSYQRAVTELQDAFNGLADNDYAEKRKLLRSFSQKYLMLRELWEKYFRSGFAFL